MTLLPGQPAPALAIQPPEERWLIEDLWAAEAVGIVGGEPQCCQSFLALDVAVAVASGAPCLRWFRPARTGRVLRFAAEDTPHVVRARLAGMARAAGVVFETLDLQVITAPTLRLDLPADQDPLRETVAALRPTLLVLDPFVRLHRIDENAAAEVAPVLATCVSSSATSTPPSCSCTMPARGPRTPVPGKPCAAPPTCTRGATISRSRLCRASWFWVLRRGR